MKAAYWSKINSLELVETEIPELRDDDVLLKIAYCGICDNDMQIITGGYPPLQPPKFLGHEYSGVIEKVGKNVTDFKVGQRVIANMQDFCGHCWYCHNGLEHFCANKNTVSGAFAEYVVTPQNTLEVLPEGVSLKVAAMAEPLSAAIHAMDRAEMKSGKQVAVIGAGALGQMIVMLAVRQGAANIVMIDSHKEKRTLALKNGADTALSFEEATHEKTMELTNNHGFDYVFEETGLIENDILAMKLAAVCGTIIIGASASFGAEPIQVDQFLFRCEKELTMRGSIQSPYTFERAVAMLPKLSDRLESLVTEIYPLEDIKLALKKQQEGNSIRILIKPN